MSRIMDLTIKRAKANRPTGAWARYWDEHAPDAHDLAELFKISARRVRELWQEGHLTKGGTLQRTIAEYRTYQNDVLGSAGHVGGAPRHRG